MSAKRGVANSGGRPTRVAAAAPHPGGQLYLPPGFNAYTAWAAQPGAAPLETVADNASERDRYANQPNAQTLRAAAIAAIMVDLQVAWDEVVAGDYRRFAAAHTTFLNF